MRRGPALLAIATAGIFLAACTTESSFTALSSKDVNLSSIRLTRSQYRGHSLGQDCDDIIFVFPTGTPNVKEATDRALEGRQGNVLLNARVASYDFYIPLIYGRACWRVTGDVYDTN